MGPRLPHRPAGDGTALRIIVPLPSRDFDPTEVAVPWKVLRGAGHEIAFATPDGARGYADAIMLTGQGLDPWGLVPGLQHFTLVGSVLRADRAARDTYATLEEDEAFLRPERHDRLDAAAYDALLLPGGHRARGMRAYLESAAVASFTAAMFDAGKPVGAICHGVLVAARATSQQSGRSVLYGRKTTSLTWRQEHLAWSIARVSRFWDPNYYRTYNEAAGEAQGYCGVQAEVTRALASPADYLDVPRDIPDFARKTDGRHRDSMDDERPAFVVRDGNYVSARWPGDAYTFAKTFAQVLAEKS